MSQRSSKIIVAPSILGGRGVMAIDDIMKGEVLEICPVIVIPHSDVSKIHNSVLHDYYFIWGDDELQAAIALGFGSMYNHATHPNAEYEMDFEQETIDFYALIDIPAGTEITINYNGKSGNIDSLWFTTKE
jgi:SET domain-containing protein